MNSPNLETIVKVVVYSLILIFRLRDRRITTGRMQVFLSGCHFLRQIRQFVVKREVKVCEIPIELIRELLHQHSYHFTDPGNVLVFGTNFLVRSGWMLVQTSTGVYRWAYCIPIPIKDTDIKCLACPQFIYNLFRLETRTTLYIFPETLQQGGITWAASAHVAVVNSPFINHQEVESKLKSFFSSPKYLQYGDMVVVDESLSFLVKAVQGTKSDRKNFGFLVEERKSSLFQLTGANSLRIPYKFKLKRNWISCCPFDSFEDIVNCVLPVQPGGLSELSEEMLHLMMPFVTVTGEETIAVQPLCPPSFLLSGPSGSGKRMLINSVADFLGLHLVQASCLSLLGESSKATELRIRALFQSARQVAPSILYLTDIEVIRILTMRINFL